MKKPEPTQYPGTYDPAEIPNRARFRDPLGHTYTRRGDLAVGQASGVEYQVPIGSLWRPLEILGRATR